VIKMTETDQPKVEEEQQAPAEEGEQPEKEKGAGLAGFMSAYYGFLQRLKARPMRVAVTKDEARMDMSEITNIPKITEDGVDEVEIVPIKQNYSYVRIRYDNVANEYTYEVIEPKLTDDETDVLSLLKETIVASVEQILDKEDDEKEAYLTRMAEELMAQLNSA
jgi:hypothetical protein